RDPDRSCNARIHPGLKVYRLRSKHRQGCGLWHRGPNCRWSSTKARSFCPRACISQEGLGCHTLGTWWGMEGGGSPVHEEAVRVGPVSALARADEVIEWLTRRSRAIVNLLTK